MPPATLFLAFPSLNLICGVWIGRKLQANAEADSEGLVDPPKVEDKIGAVPNGLSTDSDVAKRCFILSCFFLFIFCFGYLLFGELKCVCLFV